MSELTDDSHVSLCASHARLSVFLLGVGRTAVHQRLVRGDWPFVWRGSRRETVDL